MILSLIKYIVLAVLLSLNIYADSNKTDAQINIEIFDGLCAQNFNNYSNIKHMVKAIGGKEAPSAFTNSDPVLRKKGGSAYIVPSQKRKFLVSYANNAGCSISTDKIDHSNLSKLIIDNYSAKIINTSTEGIQIDEYYIIDKNSSIYNGSIIYLMYAKEKVNSTSGTISFLPKETADILLKENKYRKIFKESMKKCDMGDAEACNTIGYMYHTGTNVDQNYSKASKFYVKACDGKNADGCNNLGLLYANGQGVKLDYNIARGFFKKACMGGNVEACKSVKKLNKLKYTIDECKSKMQEYKHAIDMVNKNIQKQDLSLIIFYTKEKIKISYEVEKVCTSDIVGAGQAKKMHEGMIFDRKNANKTLEMTDNFINTRR